MRDGFPHDQYIERLSQSVAVPADVLQCEDIILQLAADREAIREFVAMFVARLLRNADFFPAEFNERNFALSPITREYYRPYDVLLSDQEGKSEAILTPYVYGLCTPLDGDLEIETYRLPDHWRPEVYDPSVEAVFDGRETCVPGQVVQIRPGLIIKRIVTRQPTLVLKIVSKPAVPFEWSFDPETLKPWQSISSLPWETNAVHACIGASLLEDPRFVEPLEKLTSHGRHFVRWEALKALVSLETDRGLATLAAFANDQHPHVAETARRASARLLSTRG